MPIELKYLVASALLFILMIGVQALMGIVYQGIIPLIGSRDSLKDDKVLIGRAKRANQNMIEAMVLFVVSVIGLLMILSQILPF